MLLCSTDGENDYSVFGDDPRLDSSEFRQEDACWLAQVGPPVRVKSVRRR